MQRTKELKEIRSIVNLEVNVAVDEAKNRIVQFYHMYDRKMKQHLTHPLFQGLDSSHLSKVQVLTEQVELLENEVVKRIKDLVWA